MKHFLIICFCFLVLQPQYQCATPPPARSQPVEPAPAKPKTTPKKAPAKPKFMVEVKPKMVTGKIIPEKRITIPTTELISALSREVAPNLRMRLDVDNSEIVIKGEVAKFKLPKIKVSPIAREWEYSIRDINSRGVAVSKAPMVGVGGKLGPNRISINISFETDGSEIKGVCPGCVLGNKDNRAPDLDWKSPAVTAIVVPTVLNKKLGVYVEKMIMDGDLRTGGSLYDGFIPGMLTFMRRNIEQTVKQELERVFKKGAVQNAISNALKQSFASKGITNISYIGINQDGVLEIVGR